MDDGRQVVKHEIGRKVNIVDEHGLGVGDTRSVARGS